MKAEDGEIHEDDAEATKNAKSKASVVEGSVGGAVAANQSERKPSTWLRRDGNQRPAKMVKFGKLGLVVFNLVEEF